MITYRCHICGTTETGTPERLDQFWITLPAEDAPAGPPAAPRHFCGPGCLADAGDAGVIGPRVIQLATLDPLTEWFHAHAHAHRFVALLSPT